MENINYLSWQENVTKRDVDRNCHHVVIVMCLVLVCVSVDNIGNHYTLSVRSVKPRVQKQCNILQC